MRKDLNTRAIWSGVILSALWGVILAWRLSPGIGPLPLVTAGIVLSLIAWSACFAKGWKTRVALFAVILFAVVFVLPVSLFMYSRSHNSPAASVLAPAMDVNPLVRSDDEIIGQWSGKDEQLTLAADKTFSRQTAGHTETGTWTRTDWNLYLKCKDYSAGMRFVTLNRQYLLLTHPVDFSDDEGYEGLATAIASALQKVKEVKPTPAPVSK